MIDLQYRIVKQEEHFFPQVRQRSLLKLPLVRIWGKWGKWQTILRNPDKHGDVYILRDFLLPLQAFSNTFKCQKEIDEFDKWFKWQREKEATSKKVLPKTYIPYQPHTTR